MLGSQSAYPCNEKSFELQKIFSEVLFHSLQSLPWTQDRVLSHSHYLRCGVRSQHIRGPWNDTKFHVRFELSFLTLKGFVDMFCNTDLTENLAYKEEEAPF